MNSINIQFIKSILICCNLPYIHPLCRIFIRFSLLPVINLASRIRCYAGSLCVLLSGSLKQPLANPVSECAVRINVQRAAPLPVITSAHIKIIVPAEFYRVFEVFPAKRGNRFVRIHPYPVVYAGFIQEFPFFVVQFLRMGSIKGTPAVFTEIPFFTFE